MVIFITDSSPDWFLIRQFNCLAYEMTQLWSDSLFSTLKLIYSIYIDYKTE